MRMCLILTNIVHDICIYPIVLGGDLDSSRYDDLVQDDSNALAILDDYFTGVSWPFIGYSYI